jgi:hypothetical protein
VNDRRLAAVCLCAVLALAGVQLAHTVGGTSAYFTDSQPGSITGSLATPVPHLSATVRIVPQKINLKGHGDVTAFVDGLPDPHQLSDIDLSSVQLCYQGACIPSDGPAKLDGNGHVAARFDGTAVAVLVGSDHGDLTLVVQGTLTAGGTFSGQSTNRITDASDDALGAAEGAVPSAAPSATPTPDPGATPTPAPTSTDSPSPTPTAAPSPTATDTPTPTPTATPDPTPAPSPTPTDTATPTDVPTASPASS